MNSTVQATPRDWAVGTTESSKSISFHINQIANASCILRAASIAITVRTSVTNHSINCFRSLGDAKHLVHIYGNVTVRGEKCDHVGIYDVITRFEVTKGEAAF